MLCLLLSTKPVRPATLHFMFSDTCCRSAGVGSIHNHLAGISIFWDRKIPHAANQRVGTIKTQPISDSLALRSSCASLTSAAVSVIWFSDGSRSSAHSLPPLTPRDRIEVKVYLKKQPVECNMEGSTSHWKLLVYAWYNLVGFLSQTDRSLFCKNVTSLARSDSGTSPLLTAVCLNDPPPPRPFSVCSPFAQRRLLEECPLANWRDFFRGVGRVRRCSSDFMNLIKSSAISCTSRSMYNAPNQLSCFTSLAHTVIARMAATQVLGLGFQVLYIWQLISFRALNVVVYRCGCRYLPYSVHFSEFMAIFFTRKRTKH